MCIIFFFTVNVRKCSSYFLSFSWDFMMGADTQQTHIHITFLWAIVKCTFKYSSSSGNRGNVMRWCDAVASHGLNVAFNFIIIAVDFSLLMADFLFLAAFSGQVSNRNNNRSEKIAKLESRVKANVLKDSLLLLLLVGREIVDNDDAVVNNEF